MQVKTLRRKKLVVDGRHYEASVTCVSRHNEPICLRVTFRARFGHRSFCIIRGLKNYGFYWNYDYWSDPAFSEPRDLISVTPRLLTELIRHAHHQGWSPDDVKSNYDIELSNEEAKALLADRDAARREASDEQADPAETEVGDDE